MGQDVNKEAATSVPIHELIAKRWSPRAFSGEALPLPTLQRILEAGRWAPSCFNEQPWRFIVAMRGDSEGFARALGCLKEANQRWSKNASVLLFTTAKKTFTRNGKDNRHALHDLGLAVENMVLQALADGWHTHQMAGIDVDAVREAYAVPDDFDVVTGIAIGNLDAPDTLPEPLDEREKAPRERKPLSEIAFVGRFGDPYDA